MTASSRTSSSEKAQEILTERTEELVGRRFHNGDERLLVEVPQGSRLIEPAISPDRTTLAYVRQLIPIVIPGESGGTMCKQG